MTKAFHEIHSEMLEAKEFDTRTAEELIADLVEKTGIIILKEDGTKLERKEEIQDESI